VCRAGPLLRVSHLPSLLRRQKWRCRARDPSALDPSQSWPEIKGNARHEAREAYFFFLLSHGWRGTGLLPSIVGHTREIVNSRYLSGWCTRDRAQARSWCRERCRGGSSPALISVCTCSCNKNINSSCQTRHYTCEMCPRFLMPANSPHKCRRATQTTTRNISNISPPSSSPAHRTPILPPNQPHNPTPRSSSVLRFLYSCGPGYFPISLY